MVEVVVVGALDFFYFYNGVFYFIVGNILFFCDVYII